MLTRPLGTKRHAHGWWRKKTWNGIASDRMNWFIDCGVVGESKHRMGPPNTSEERFPNEYAKVRRSAETRNLRKSVLTSKVVNPFTRDLKPPFTGRRRDFYISKLPSNLKNIPSVNTYMNVFYIPWFAELITYIYKPATSSHFEPRLLMPRFWLSLPLTFDSSFAGVISYRDSWIGFPKSHPKWSSSIPRIFPKSSVP
jgi:hypothetical protein